MFFDVSRSATERPCNHWWRATFRDSRLDWNASFQALACYQCRPEEGLRRRSLLSAALTTPTTAAAAAQTARAAQGRASAAGRRRLLTLPPRPPCTASAARGALVALPAAQTSRPLPSPYAAAGAYPMFDNIQVMPCLGHISVAICVNDILCQESKAQRAHAQRQRPCQHIKFSSELDPACPEEAAWGCWSLPDLHQSL